MVKVDFGFTVATVDEGQWQNEDPAFVALLESTRPLYGPSGAAPNRDVALAESAIEALGGIITEQPEPEADDGVIY